MEIKAIFEDISAAEQALVNAEQLIGSKELGEAPNETYTAVPTINGSYKQHNTFWAGQPGDVRQGMLKLKADTLWARNMLQSLRKALERQDKDAAHVLETFDMQANSAGVGSFECFEPRDKEPFKNLSYNTPAMVVESMTPLEGLIAMFQGDDGIPLDSSRRWTETAASLESVAAQLRSVSAQLGASNKGKAFDEARTAIEDFAKRSETMAANTALMAESVAQFPTVRNMNLAGLEAIKAKKDAALAAAAASGPASPAAVAAIEAETSAEVKAFLSSSLRPSLDMVKPPVQNFGKPVIGHNGGGSAKITSFDSTGPAEIFEGIAGNVEKATGNAIQELGAQTQEAVADPGRGNPGAVQAPTGNAGPGPANHIPADHAHVNPSGLGNGAPQAPSVTPAGTNLPTNTPHQAVSGAPTANTGGAPGVGFPGTAGNNGAYSTGMGATNPGARGGASGTNTGVGRGAPGAGLGTGHAAGQGAGTPAGQSSGQSTGQNLGQGADNRFRGAAGINTHSMGTGNPGAAGESRPGRATVVRPELPAAHQDAVRYNNANRGMNGPAGGGYAASGQANQATGGRGFYGGMGGGAGAGAGGARGARKAKAGNGQWGHQVTEYFKRQFLGPKPKTTRKVITK